MVWGKINRSFFLKTAVRFNNPSTGELKFDTYLSVQLINKRWKTLNVKDSNDGLIYWYEGELP